MNKTASGQIWAGRLGLTFCALMLMFISLIPLNFQAPIFPPPDLLFALTFATLLRRPELVPFWLILIIFLLADILLMRPLGLWTALILVAAEFSRPQEYRFRELAVPFEWAFVTGIFFLTLLTYRVILSLSVVPQVKFSTFMLHFLATVLAYPLVVLFCHYVLRIRKLTPEQATQLGHRL